MGEVSRTVAARRAAFWECGVERSMSDDVKQRVEISVRTIRDDRGVQRGHEVCGYDD